MNRYLPALIVAMVALLTLGGGLMLYRAKRLPVLTTSTDKSAVAEGLDRIHARGPATAPVTLEEFGDFQCPPCGGLSEPLNEMERQSNGKVRIVFHELPLAMHPHARAAAWAAEAAGLQGKFWEMHDLLYREQVAWSKATDARIIFKSYAGVLGLDLARFQKDMAGPEVKERVAHDEAHAKEVGVTNTPTIFINGTSVPATSLNVASIRAAIDAALAAKSPAK